jgi:thiamine-phosphate pyrophosphorylase
MISIPRLYAIIDRACFAPAPDATAEMVRYARELMAGGVTLIQYRNKTGNARQMLSDTRELQRVCAAFSTQQNRMVRLIMNDRADLCLAAGLAGVHVGQTDLSPEAVRGIVGNERWVGVSTHLPAQIAEADRLPADYVAVGPVFATANKADADPVIGLEGVSRARALTGKPLVAIGGITRANCRAVLEAGADSVSVIGDLLVEPKKAAREFLEICNL